MEGLIPMVYRAIKKNRVRSRYECLSSGASHRPQAYDISDFYVDGYAGLARPSEGEARNRFYSSPPAAAAAADYDKPRHRRYSSATADFSYGFGAGEGDVMKVKGGDRPERLLRFRSHGRMLSCFSGVS